MTEMKDWPLAKVAAPEGEDYTDHVMVCLRPDLDFRDRWSSLRVTTEETDDLHITLWYGGEIGGSDADLQERDKERLMRACFGTALATTRKITGKVNGFGWFLNDDNHVLVALWDLPYLSEFRERFLAQCKIHEVPLREENHGFTPHMTLAYQDPATEEHRIPSFPTGGTEEVTFGEFYLTWGKEWIPIPLT